MNDRTREYEETVRSGRTTLRAQYAVLGAVCALVIGVYAWSAHSGWLEVYSLNAENTYYNLLVRGFRTGQLNLKREVPLGLSQLSNPYDPKAMSPYLVVKFPLHDLSYYQGKLYLYFGVTPALLVFWPYAVLTGHYLLHKDAVVIFFSVGFLAGVGLLWGAWRRYFAEIKVGVVAAGALALGLVNFAPVILQRCEVYEVAISCGYALTMVTLLLLWRAMHAAQGRVWWLAGASLGYGLALGARPSLLFGAVILLAPVVWGGQKAEGRKQNSVFAIWLAATTPITLIGLGLILYNYLRFDHPLEFGSRYQLTFDRVSALEQFGLRFLWFNFRVGLLAPARWSVHFPFVHDIVVPPLPKGGVAEQLPFGILTNIPLVLFALAAPLAWRSGPALSRSLLRRFSGAVALLFGTCALTLGFHNSMTLRYQLEFVSPLVLLAVVGIFGSERESAGRLVWRRAARWSWGLLLVFSVAFNLFASIFCRVETENGTGILLLQEGWTDAAITHFRKVLEIQPGFATAHNNLGEALIQQGRVAEAIGHYEQALQLQPDLAEAHINLASALLQQGKMPEATEHYEAGLRLKPDLGIAHFNLGNALVQQGRVLEAINHYEQALRFQPDYAAAHNNLAWALLQQGQAAEAIRHYEQALQLQPGFAEAHYNLGKALIQVGRAPEAVEQFAETLRLKPEDVEARSHLAWVLATCAEGKVRDGLRAVALAEGANQWAGGKAAAVLDTLGAAYAEAGRYGEAVGAAQGALGLAQAAGQTESARQIEARLRLYQAGRPYHEGSATQP